ncbi:MAG: hypothetical protein JXA57_05625 [Armatimonadetes bacterium]|nr:hypothetical protein [Armatimonadota bacterium]
MGVTLVHEHLIHDMRAYFKEPADSSDSWLVREPVSLANVGWVRAHQLSNLDNLVLDDRGLAVDELSDFKMLGGSTVVELTSRDMFGQDADGLADIAAKSGVNIVMGTGWDLIVKRGSQLQHLSDEEIHAGLVSDVEIGVGAGKVRAGIIGEIGLMDLAPLEERVLRCCARAQLTTGVALSVHPSDDEKLLPRTLEILREAGAALDRTIVCHVDLMGFGLDAVRAAAEAGCYVAFDNFGVEGAFNHPSSGKQVELSDVARIAAIIELVEEGYLERILISHDIATKDRLRRYGGCGYGHILRTVVPRLNAGGLTAGQVGVILKDNPRRVLCN